MRFGKNYHVPFANTAFAPYSTRHAGDFQADGRVKLDVDEYLGVDVVSELIQANHVRYSSHHSAIDFA